MKSPNHELEACEATTCLEAGMSYEELVDKIGALLESFGSEYYIKEDLRKAV